MSRLHLDPPIGETLDEGICEHVDAAVRRLTGQQRHIVKSYYFAPDWSEEQVRQKLRERGWAMSGRVFRDVLESAQKAVGERLDALGI